VNLLTQYVSGAFCSICIKLVQINGTSIKDSICKCGNKKLSPVASKLKEAKQGWDYFNLTGKFIGCVLLEKTTNQVVKTKPNLNHTKPKVCKQLTLF